MNIMQKAKTAVMGVPHHLPSGSSPHRGTFKGFLVDKGTRYTAMAGFAYAKGYYGPKFVWKNHGADLWLGVGGLLATALLQAASGGKSKIAPTVERIADAGVMSAIDSLVTKWGMDRSPPGTWPALPPTSKVHGIGAIPPAQVGPYLSPDDVARYAQRR